MVMVRLFHSETPLLLNASCRQLQRRPEAVWFFRRASALQQMVVTLEGTQLKRLDAACAPVDFHSWPQVGSVT